MKIYIAGFGVFRKDAAEYGKILKNICGKYGYEGLYPLDNESDNAEEIYRGNISLIKKADVIIADINPFRGQEPDSGTAFEIGYAAALGKRIICYMENAEELKSKIKPDEFSVEDFGFPVNLMLACSADIVQGGFEDAVKKLV